MALAGPLLPDYAEGVASGGGGGGDTNPPTVTIEAVPAEPYEPMVLRVVDTDPGVAYLGVFLKLPGDGGRETVAYRRGVFKPPFTQGSTLSVDGDDLVVSLYYDREGRGWPLGTSAYDVDALDGDGNDEGAP